MVSLRTDYLHVFWWQHYNISKRNYTKSATYKSIYKMIVSPVRPALVNRFWNVGRVSRRVILQRTGEKMVNAAHAMSQIQWARVSRGLDLRTDVSAYRHVRLNFVSSEKIAEVSALQNAKSQWTLTLVMGKVTFETVDVWEVKKISNATHYEAMTQKHLWAWTLTSRYTGNGDHTAWRKRRPWPT